MDGEFIISMVSSVGFPIAVAWFTLTQMNKTVAENTKVLSELSSAIMILSSQVNKEKGGN